MAKDKNGDKNATQEPKSALASDSKQEAADPLDAMKVFGEGGDPGTAAGGPQVGTSKETSPDPGKVPGAQASAPVGAAGAQAGKTAVGQAKPQRWIVQETIRAHWKGTHVDFKRGKPITEAGYGPDCAAKLTKLGVKLEEG